MRSFFYFSILAAFSLLCLGCEQLPEDDSDKGQSLTINAIYDNGHSKATVLDGETSVYWEPEDEIKVFCGQASGKLISTNVEDSPTATFTGFVSGEINPSAKHNLYGLYPYREDASFDDGVITTTIPEVQTAVVGSFDRNANIAVAISESTDLMFRNVCGGLRFTLTNPGIKRIVFESNGGEHIAGRFSTRFEAGAPAVTEVRDGSCKVTLKTEEGSTFKTGVWYYMTFLPVTLTEGYTVTFITDTQSATLEVNKEQTIKRCTYGTVHDIDKHLEWKKLEQYDYVIATDFADWDNACFGRNGELIMLKDCSGEESAGRAYMLLPSETNGLDEFYASFDGNDVPDMVYINGMSIKVASVQDGLADVLVNFGDTLNVIIDSLAVPFDDARTKSFSENNGIRNACAIARLVLGAVEGGAGTLMVGASVASIPATRVVGIGGVISGAATFRDGYNNVSSSYSTLFAPATESYQGNWSDVVVSVGETMFEDGLNRTFESCASEGQVESFNNLKIFKGLDIGKVNKASSVLSIIGHGIDWVDNTFGRTVTERDRALMKYSGFSVITGVLKDNGPSWATISAYVGPDPYSRCSSWDCGLIINGSDGFHDYYQSYSYGYFDHTFNGLKRGVTFSYQTYFHDKEHGFVFWGQTRSFTTNPCPDDEHVHAIDLGLSVKWACHNVGATKPEEFGSYYAWGETEEKSFYGWDTYMFHSNYFTQSDDVAHEKLGNDWRMPTRAEFEELINNCDTGWITVNGVSGRYFTSKITGNSIFLPAAGERRYGELENVGIIGDYWSSSVLLDSDDGSGAVAMVIYPGGINLDTEGGASRFRGMTVRPVFIEEKESE